jgi:hypothetical protein
MHPPSPGGRGTTARQATNRREGKFDLRVLCVFVLKIRTDLDELLYPFHVMSGGLGRHHEFGFRS